MPSDIDYQSINENFPVPGQDNDTQVFRDNFDTIKNSLRRAKDEITDLQDNTVRSDRVNDLKLSEISNGLFLNNRDQKFDYGNPIDAGIAVIDYQNAPYQIYKLAADTVFSFLNFPGDPTITPSSARNVGVGKVTLELYSDQETLILSANMIENQKYVIVSVGNSDFTSVGAASNTTGLIFTSTGPTPGSGTVSVVREVTFSDLGSGNAIKKLSGFPNPFYVSSATNPKFIEVWRWRPNEIFVRYLGEAS